MQKQIEIGDKIIEETNPVFIIAEISANHLQNYDRAVEIIKKQKNVELMQLSSKLIRQNPLQLIVIIHILGLPKALYGMVRLYINCIKKRIRHGSGSLI